MENKNIKNIGINNLITDFDSNLIEYENNDLGEKCDEPKLQHCCNVMVEHKTHLTPPAFCHSKILSKINIDIKVEKVCAGAVIISGIIHKSLCYKALLENGTIDSSYKKCIDIPFNCFINTDEANEDDEYEVTGHDLLCTYVNNTDLNNDCNNNQKKRCCMHIEKTLIKICVMRK